MDHPTDDAHSVSPSIEEQVQADLAVLHKINTEETLEISEWVEDLIKETRKYPHVVSIHQEKLAQVSSALKKLHHEMFYSTAPLDLTDLMDLFRADKDRSLTGTINKVAADLEPMDIASAPSEQPELTNAVPVPSAQQEPTNITREPLGRRYFAARGAFERNNDTTEPPLYGPLTLEAQLRKEYEDFCPSSGIPDYSLELEQRREISTALKEGRLRVLTNRVTDQSQLYEDVHHKIAVVRGDKKVTPDDRVFHKERFSLSVLPHGFGERKKEPKKEPKRVPKQGPKRDPKQGPKLEMNLDGKAFSSEKLEEMFREAFKGMSKEGSKEEPNKRQDGSQNSLRSVTNNGF